MNNAEQIIDNHNKRTLKSHAISNTTVNDRRKQEMQLPTKTFITTQRQLPPNFNHLQSDKKYSLLTKLAKCTLKTALKL